VLPFPSYDAVTEKPVRGWGDLPTWNDLPGWNDLPPYGPRPGRTLANRIIYGQSPIEVLDISPISMTEVPLVKSLKIPSATTWKNPLMESLDGKPWVISDFSICENL